MSAEGTETTMVEIKPKKQMVIEDKISIFGALGMSKPVREMVVELLNVEKAKLELLTKMEQHQQKSATAHKVIADSLTRIVYALESQTSIMRRG